MKTSLQSALITLFVCSVLFTACEEKQNTYTKIEPAKLEQMEGSDVEKLTLTEKAVERIDIKTSTVKEEAIDNNPESNQKVVPYASVLYDTEGKTWVYTNPNPLVYIRKAIDVDRIEGDIAFLTAGPSIGTVIVIQGASELLGAEFHVGH